MEARAYFKNQRIPPKKLRFLLSEIKKLTPSEALTRLFYSPNRSSKIFYSSIKSAVSNAINVLKVEEKVLRFKHLSVEQGQKLKRFKAGARGTAKPIAKRFSHIKIILEAEEPKSTEAVKTKMPAMTAGKQEGKKLPAKNSQTEKKAESKLEIKETRKKVSRKK